MKYIIYCTAGMKSNETMLFRSDERKFYCVEKPESLNPVEVLKIFQASRRNRNLRSSLRDNMVSFDFIPAVQYMMYFIYIFHT